jgi:hypothetical protein
MTGAPETSELADVVEMLSPKRRREEVLVDE